MDFSHARKYAETIELDTIRRSTGADKDPREGMVASVKYLLKSSLLRAMGMGGATKKGQVQKFFYNKLQRHSGQPMAELVSVKAAPDMKVEGLNVEVKSMGWHLFEKCILTLERLERFWDVLLVNTSSQPFEKR